MASRARHDQLWVEVEDSFGTINAVPVWILCRAKFEAPDYQEELIESPENYQELIYNELVRGNTGPGDLAFTIYWQGQGAGAVDKTALFTKNLLGAQLDAGTWDKDLDPLVKQTISPTGCDLGPSPSGFLTTHVGGLIAVQDANGDYHARQLSAITVNNPVGFDHITWTPALPSAPLADTKVYAMSTMYADLDGSGNSLQMKYKGEDNDDILQFLGMNGSATLDLDPSLKPPHAALNLKMRYASHAFGTPVALTYTADDNYAPILLSGGMEILVCGYSGSARATTRTAVAASSIQLDFGLQQEANLNGNYANNVGGWTPVRGASFLNLKLRIAWNKAAYTAWAAGTNYHVLISWGKTQNGVGALYMPNVVLKTVKRVNVKGSWYTEYVFQPVHHADQTSSPVNAVDLSPILIGHLG